MTQQHPLDQATQLEEIAQGHWRGAAIEHYGNMVGAFGGVVAAVFMKAVLNDARLSGQPVSQTVNFCTALALGPFEISSRLLRAGKYTQHWSLELTQNDTICASSSVVIGARADVFSHQPAGRPQVAAYEECQPLPPLAPVNWVKAYEFRFVEGVPVMAAGGHDQPGATRSMVWMRDEPARPLDYVALTALSDGFFLRLLQVRGTMVPAGTVTMTTHFLASPDEIAAQGAAPLLGVADSQRFHGQFHDQTMQLWGEAGNLLATGTQVVWYRQ